MNELFEANRRKGVQKIRDAIMDHFGHMGKAAAFDIDLGDGLVVVAGPSEDVLTLLVTIDVAMVDRACEAYDKCVDYLGDSAMEHYCNDVPMRDALRAVFGGPMTKYEGKD